MEILDINDYCSRWQFILDRCKGRKVLHLGCIGETDGSLEVKAAAYERGRVLHPHLINAASEVVGIDLNEPAVEMLRARFGVTSLFVADVQRLDEISLTDRFDVIVFGDLIEHLSSPGLALDGIRRFMTDQSELIISTPNAFALLANVRYSLGRYREGAEHVAAYSKFTLPTLLERHQLKLTELFTCYTRPPERGKLRFSLGVGCFKMVPERGGTLLAVAKKVA